MKEKHPFGCFLFWRRMKDDCISILKNVTIYVNGKEALKGLEHLIEKDDE
ncbi:hypothetical protein bcere0016_24770 [Bacillus cereus 95/8201]|nr:hypothetical protein bcere0016_24770 [Bacillus cereus 95/8201]